MAGNLSDVTADEDHQRIFRESVCVFEDKTLRYGPFFALCALSTKQTSHASNKIAYLKTQWVERLICQGLSDLRQYEAGGEGNAGLQSMIWKLFCDKTGCAMDLGWPAALALIEFEMAGCKR
jgi:hypothetical protein